VRIHSCLWYLVLAALVLALLPEQPGQSAAQQPPEQSSPLPVDDSSAAITYANFSRVTGTPEEMIIDFALNDQMSGPRREPIKIQQRIVLNFYTAKRLLGALQLAVQRHEDAFGPIETDVQKRLKNRLGGRPNKSAAHAPSGPTALAAVPD
jgi:hypothetical protein